MRGPSALSKLDLAALNTSQLLQLRAGLTAMMGSSAGQKNAGDADSSVGANSAAGALTGGGPVSAGRDDLGKVQDVETSAKTSTGRDTIGEVRADAQTSAGEGTGGTVGANSVCGTAAPLSKAEQARINGAKSRGPVSAEGKAASSQNAFKHGLTAKGVLAPGEDPAEFTKFQADFVTELRPAGTVQLTLVHRAAELAWKLKRMASWEGAILCGRSKHSCDDPATLGSFGALIAELENGENDGVLLRLQRYETRLERSFQLCLRELRQLKADAAKDAERDREAVSEIHGPSRTHSANVEAKAGRADDQGAQPVVDAATTSSVGSFCTQGTSTLNSVDRRSADSGTTSPVGSFCTHGFATLGDASFHPANADLTMTVGSFCTSDLSDIGHGASLKNEKVAIRERSALSEEVDVTRASRPCEVV